MDLTQEVLRSLLFYDGESGKFFSKRNGIRFKIGDEITSTDVQGRLIFYINRKQYKLHRLAWLYEYGYWPNVIDHINGNNSDNRISNLRDTSCLINSQNFRSATKNNKSSRLLGVSKKRNKWSAQIRINGNIKRLGCYDTKEAAYEIYLENKRKFHEGCTI